MIGPSPTAHPAANIFPMLDEARLTRLADDIKREGLKVPIVLLDGQILDGRNRWRACEMAGVEPRFVQFDGGNPWRYVLSLNAQRRDLDPGQRAAIVLKGQRAAEDFEAKERARKEAANQRRAEKAKEQIAEQPRGAKGRVQPGVISPDMTPGPRQGFGAPVTELAATAGVSAPTAARVQSLANQRPELLEQVAAGTLGLAEATRQMKREQVAAKVEPLPSAKFRVLYADPPWQYNDSRAGLDGYAATAAEDHYPTMSKAELCALPVRALAEDDAVLLCWATFPLLPDALEVVRAWGFTYKTAFVWAKQRPNFGHYHNASAELLLVCTRGSGVPDADKREDQVQAVPREGRHSGKPEHFRALVDRLWTSGRRIELFRRGAAPEGWSVWGNEARGAPNDAR